MSTISAQNKVKVLLVEDHPIFRKGLAQIIDATPNLAVCGEADDYFGALRLLAERDPDVAIVDISLRDASGIELVKDIRRKHPRVLILMLSMFDENIYAERALRAGARGYLMKAEAPETVITAVNRILAGKVYVSENVEARILDRLVEGGSGAAGDPVELLSDRELEIYRLIGGGLGTREIAAKLHASVKTVENHRAHIKEKLGLKSSIELVQHATLWAQGEGRAAQ